MGCSLATTHEPLNRALYSRLVPHGRAFSAGIDQGARRLTGHLQAFLSPLYCCDVGSTA